MARKMYPAKRANKSNPRADRNAQYIDNILDFGSFEPNTKKGAKQKRTSNRTAPQDNVTPFTKPKSLELIPRNLAQEKYIDALNDDSKTIVFGVGPAGTGKSMAACHVAISHLQAGLIKKIVITRPLVGTDGGIGFLPGNILEKMAPWVAPMLDYFKEVYSPQQLIKLIEQEVIEIAPLGFIRGRTFKSAIVIVDECQLSTQSQLQACLTRIGEGTRLFATGDLKQYDQGFEENGLKDFLARLKKHKSDLITVCEFGNGDIERHPIVGEVLRIYGQE